MRGMMIFAAAIWWVHHKISPHFHKLAKKEKKMGSFNLPLPVFFLLHWHMHSAEVPNLWVWVGHWWVVAT